MNTRITIVENDKDIALDIKNCLENLGYTVPVIANCAEQAIEQAVEFKPDLALINVMLQDDAGGIEIAEFFIKYLNIPVVYITEHFDINIFQKAKKTNPFGYIIKPFEQTQLLTIIEIALHKHQAEVTIKKALNKEKQMREDNSRLISIVNHEFRNPLTTIFTSTELLSNYNQRLSETKRSEYIQHIQNAVKYMTNLLADILLIGNAEGGQINYNPAPLDLEKFCQTLVAEIQLCDNNNHKIIFTKEKYKITEDNSISNNSQLATTKTLLPCLDEKVLRHILTNLLTNAIKYSPQGTTVHFDLTYIQKEVIFRIQDEGIGIPEAEQKNLFNSFYRASNVGKIPGYGLGLAIVKQYVELHGGEITFVSKEGVGTTFIVSLPFTI